ncbi:MAG: small multi-drug export protein [Epulopiscium sp.]|nr:small multi-drug export protein [Candidatus Epulonipiscium sp.]
MDFFPDELMTFFIAAVPVLEQKVAIPYGIIQGIGFWEVYLLTLLGAVFPSPFIILFVNKIFKLLRKIPKMHTITHWIEERTMKKSKSIAKYQLLGLFIFVAIPLPGTGVWTGSLAAALLYLEFKRSILVVFLGAMVSGILISFLTYGIGIFI